VRKTHAETGCVNSPLMRFPILTYLELEKRVIIKIVSKGQFHQHFMCSFYELNFGKIDPGSSRYSIFQSIDNSVIQPSVPGI